MANLPKLKLLQELRERFGDIRKMIGSESLFIVGNDAARIYFRYSKLHEGGRTFFGLRQMDLRQLEGHNSYLCFLVDTDLPPLFVPYADFEDVFADSEPARDGQYKVQLTTKSSALELYIARHGRFNVEGYVGFETIERGMEARRLRPSLNLSHSQVQTLLAGIGHAKGYDIYVPPYDAGSLDWSLTEPFTVRRELPSTFDKLRGILGEIDVVWFAGGQYEIEGLYEVEHSTPLYSGLLRFNDVLLCNPQVARFTIASNESRRELFSRQVSRPTFQKSGLSELCSFLEYANVFEWHRRISKEANQ
jgi:hypothetical protein